MTQDKNRSFMRKWVEYWGRKKVLKPITFTDTSILTQPTTLIVGGEEEFGGKEEFGHYIRLYPKTAAIITSSTGQQQVFTEEGYREFQVGTYTIQFVDISDRVITLPKVTSITLNGPEVSLTVTISYRVINPLQIIRSSMPLQTLCIICEAATSEYIRTHRFEELVGENSVQSYEVAKFIRQQVNKTKARKAFVIIDVFVAELYDNLDIDTFEQASTLQEEQNQTKQESEIQQQKTTLRRRWKEYWGRKNVMKPIPFTETSVLTEPIAIRVESLGYYLSIPSNAAAIITSTAGRKEFFMKGGYQEIEKGTYLIEFVDLSERFITFSKIAAFTIDGSEISLTVSITYKIDDIPQIIKVSIPLQTLFSVCVGAIKNFIMTHRHDEFFGVHSISDDEIANYIIRKVAQNRACRAFSLIDVIVSERYNVLDTNRFQQARNIEEMQSLKLRENLIEKEKLEFQHNVPSDESTPWDVFISHAFEDKAFARALVGELVKKGLHVWYDEFELKIGDSLRRKIDFGLSNSRFGIVVLSPNFFAKEWTQKELGALTARETDIEKIILPIWHNISFDEIKRYSPILADRFAIKSDNTMENIVTKILDTVQSK